MPYRRIRYRYGEWVSGISPQRLGSFWDTRLTVALTQPHWTPAVDLYETPTEWVVKAEIAGMNEDDFEITLYQNALVIEGSRRCEECFEAATQFRRAEVSYGPFRLAVPLQGPVDRDALRLTTNKAFYPSSSTGQRCKHHDS